MKDFSLLEKIISDEDNVYLGKDVTFDEVKTTTSDLAPDKFPRPDGYPPYFFSKVSSLIGRSVFRAVKAFFHSGKLLKEINHTFIMLIP